MDDDERDAGQDAGQVGELTEQERQILEFERLWFRRPGAKDAAIRQAFGLSATGYYQILSALIRRPEALRHDPLLVNRLLRVSRSSRNRRGLPLT